MKLHRVFGFLAISVIISLCTGHIGGGQVDLQNIDPQMYCGRTLARALALLCFDENSNGKRSGPATMYESLLSPYYKNEESQLEWSMSPHRARSLGFPSRGKRFPGVVNECCDKACSINELMTYC